MSSSINPPGFLSLREKNILVFFNIIAGIFQIIIVQKIKNSHIFIAMFAFFIAFVIFAIKFINVVKQLANGK